MKYEYEIRTFSEAQAKEFIEGEEIVAVGCLLDNNDPDEEVDAEVVIFTGPSAKTRAFEYMDWKNGERSPSRFVN
jgi:hypothetical protein